MIVLCITCKERVQHLEQTLPKNLNDNADFDNCKFVVLDYGSRDHLQEFIRQHHTKDLISGKLVLYRFPHAGQFRMAHAKNMAHRCGIREGADVLVNLDADNFTGAGFAQYVHDQFEENPNRFLWSRMIKGELKRGISGRIAVSRDAFWNAGGYDEVFESWSPDDKDFSQRLGRLGYDACEIATQYLEAVLHSHKMRFKEYPHAAQNADNEQSMDLSHRSHLTIVNWGQVGCGTVYRNWDDTPIELKPIPTKIFGIGLHKTSTTSLHHALQILGYSSWHWLNAHSAKAIWDDVTFPADGQWQLSSVVERYNALCDLPIPLLYRQLDKGYPNSKFILTTRDENDWLESVRAHWKHNTNGFRRQWDSDPFSHRIHKELYGRRDFHADTFLNRYRQHNAEVIEYFKDRPNDLLVMDMERSGWHELCHFLNRKVPTQTVPYPKRFVTARQREFEGDYQI